MFAHSKSIPILYLLLILAVSLLGTVAINYARSIAAPAPMVEVQL